MHPTRPPVSLQKLIEALEFQNDELSGFVNPETGDVVLVSDNSLGAAEAQSDSHGIDDEEIEEAEERDLLRHALRGSGAFRRFKDLCYSLDVAESWYRFRDAEYNAFARQWCEEHGLAWTRGDDSRAPDALRCLLPTATLLKRRLER